MATLFLAISPPICQGERVCRLAASTLQSALSTALEPRRTLKSQAELSRDGLAYACDRGSSCQSTPPAPHCPGAAADFGPQARRHLLHRLQPRTPLPARPNPRMRARCAPGRCAVLSASHTRSPNPLAHSRAPQLSQPPGPRSIPLLNLHLQYPTNSLLRFLSIPPRSILDHAPICATISRPCLAILI